MNIEVIRKAIRDDNYRVTLEFIRRKTERDIWFDEVTECIMNGEIIEEYSDDPRGPSCLIHGVTNEGRFLHVCCSVNLPVWFITTYEPSPDKWEKDRKTRRKK